MGMTFLTQLYCQLYITCQLHVSANNNFGYHQVGYNYRRKTTQYIIRYSVTISVGVSRGERDVVCKRVGGRVCVCAEGLIYRSMHCHVTSMIS